MLVVNDKELEDRNDSDVSTNTVRIAVVTWKFL